MSSNSNEGKEETSPSSSSEVPINSSNRRSAFPALSSMSNDLPESKQSTKTSSLGRSTSLHSSSPRRSGSTGFNSSASGQTSPSGNPSGSQQSSRHLSFHHTRPVVPPPSNNRDLFGIAVKSSNLATSSDGLQALLRDHPELVSSSLAAAAGPTFQEFSENSTRGSRKGSQKGSGNNTPKKEYGDLPPNDEEDEEEEEEELNDGSPEGDAAVGGRDHQAPGFPGLSEPPSVAPNLGAAGELKRSWIGRKQRGTLSEEGRSHRYHFIWRS